jgi:ferredoxin-NADP reductase
MTDQVFPTEARTTVREHEGDLVVEAVDDLAEDVVALTLADPDGAALPAWTPGAHVDLVLSPGLVRQYSLCGTPADERRIRVAVLRDPSGRGGSTFVHDGLKVGSTVRVRGPRNHFPLVGSPRYLFVAGGIGITPLLPMLAQATADGADWTLVYLGRSRTTMAFLDDLAQYGDRVRVMPKDEHGPTDLGALLDAPQPDTLVYCCGPERLLAEVEERCAAGWPAGSLHLERFAARPVEVTADDAAFELVLARSGVTITVPADRSIFHAVEDAGISVLGSCHEGVCGTCEQVVLDGEVDHRDSVLSADEQATHEMMMICVSRSRSPRLVIDL